MIGSCLVFVPLFHVIVFAVTRDRARNWADREYQSSENASWQKGALPFEVMAFFLLKIDHRQIARQRPFR